LRKGAKLVRHANDILEDLQGIPALVEEKPTPPPAPPTGLDETQQKIWDALTERRLVDDLTFQLSIPITDLMRHLMTLELKKAVRRLPGNWYERF
jgi:DNA processing protein